MISTGLSYKHIDSSSIGSISNFTPPCKVNNLMGMKEPYPLTKDLILQ